MRSRMMATFGVLLIPLALLAAQAPNRFESPLALESSDAKLVEAFS